MEIHLIGSKGFIGKSIQKKSKNIDLHCWSHSNEENHNKFNLYDKQSWRDLISKSPETVLILSWPGLPNYNDPFHITRNLPLFIELVEALINSGCKNIIVAGSCYEYGDINGCINEEQIVRPNNFYAIAKDTFRRSIELMCNEKNIRWVWVRIFYPYGKDQNPNSLYPSLIRAIRENSNEFNTTSGNQKRDFISVDQVSMNLLALCKNLKARGIYNCGSGFPISISEFVQKIANDENSSIFIRKGGFPDRIGEPKEFWADMNKFESLLENS